MLGRDFKILNLQANVDQDVKTCPVMYQLTQITVELMVFLSTYMTGLGCQSLIGQVLQT